MEKNEKILFIKSAEKYIEDHKIYDLFEYLTKQLLVKKPDSPLDFLIDQFSNQKFSRLFFINGATESHSNEISNILAKEFNFKHISLEVIVQEEIKKNKEKTLKIQELLKECLPLDDDFINELVLRHISSVESNYKGTIVNGYPRTLV